MESGSERIDPRPLTSEEEHIKRNTDCVYFLASPLTCKKGSECEYRHSEGARVNPRDCKFWLSGNCMNPNCLFRHPPLDGLVGNPGATSGSIVTASLVTTSMQLPMVNSSAYNLSRNSVPCYYYFQKGACLKGDKCPFMHGPQPAGNPAAKHTANVSAPDTTQLEASKKDAWKIKGCNNQHGFSTALNIGNESPDKSVDGAPSAAKGSAALENANIHLVHKGSLLPLPPRNGLPRSQVINVPVSSSSHSWPQDLPVQSDRHHLDGREAGEISEDPSGISFTELKRPLNHQFRSVDCHQNDKGGEEVFRESSPGFDVLVDNGIKDTDYLHDRDVFRSRSIQGGRNLNLGDGYDHHHSGYESAARLDRDRRNGFGEFQHYIKVQNRGEDRHRNSSASERIAEKPVLPERRLAHRLKSPDGMDESDLRHQLMRHRRLNGSLSATSSGRHGEQYSMQDKYHTHNSPDRRQPVSKSTISSRLSGRITLSKIPSDLLNGGDRGRQRGKLSPVRPSSHQGRLGERLSRRQVEDSANARNLGGQQKLRDGADPRDFAGPRSLAELKGAKAGGNSQGQSTKNIQSISSLEQNEMKSLKAATGLQDSEVSVSFEGPKPLSALLKRKREAGPENDAISGIIEDRKAIRVTKVGYWSSEAAPEPQSQDVFGTNLESNKSVSNPEEPSVETVGEEEEEEEEGLIPAEGEQITYDEQQAAGDETEARDAVEDIDPDYTDQRDSEYDYEPVEGGGHYKTEDDENMEPMDVDIDDDEDEDDFAKKIGLIFS